jgi:hypothetical protein
LTAPREEKTKRKDGKRGTRDQKSDKGLKADGYKKEKPRKEEASIRGTQGRRVEDTGDEYKYGEGDAVFTERIRFPGSDAEMEQREARGMDSIGDDLPQSLRRREA